MDHSKLHPLVRLLVEAYARECGVEPERQWRWLEGREVPPPRWVKQQLYNFDAGLKESDFLSLPSAGENGTIAPFMQATSEREFEGRPPTDHPFVNALRARGMTLTEWCHRHNVKRQRVKSWYVKGDGARQIPALWAKRIEDEFGNAPRSKRPLLPATEDTWPNGIKD